MAPSEDNKLRNKILAATLFITKDKLEPHLLVAQTNILAKKRKAHCPVTQTQIKKFTVTYEALQVSIDNAFLGTIPEKIIVVFVKNTTFLFSASTSPFHFHHYGITNLVLAQTAYITLPNHSQYIALHPSLITRITKNYFQVRVYITMTVIT